MLFAKVVIISFVFLMIDYKEGGFNIAIGGKRPSITPLLFSTHLTNVEFQNYDVTTSHENDFFFAHPRFFVRPTARTTEMKRIRNLERRKKRRNEARMIMMKYEKKPFELYDNGR